MEVDKREQLIKRLDAGSGIQYILDTVSEVVGHPLIFIDLKYKLIANSKLGAEDDPLWAELVGTGQFSHKTVDFFFKEAKFIEAYISAPVVLMRTPGLRDRINGLIYDGTGAQFGSICQVAYYRPIEDEDYRLTEIVCERLSKQVQADGMCNADWEEMTEDALNELIDGNTALDPEHERHIQELSARLRENIYVAVIDTTHYDNSTTHLAYFTDVFKRLENNFYYFTYFNTIIMLFSTDRAVLNVEREMKKLHGFFIENNIYAGVSSVMNNLRDVKTYFKEAINALNYGLSVSCGKHILSYETFRSEMFFNAHAEDQDPIRLCHPLFLNIVDYDKQNNTNYLELLNAFFLNGLNARHAAAQLGITQKEATAAWQRIAKLFDINLIDGNLLYAIFRSIKLYKCFTERFA